MNTNDQLPDGLENGKAIDNDKFEELLNAGKVLMFSMPVEQVSQNMCAMLVDQQAMSMTAFLNTVGGRMHVNGGNVEFILHGREPYSEDSLVYTDPKQEE